MICRCVFGGVRDDIVVAVVSYVSQPEFALGAYLEALAAVERLERIDVLVIGCTYRHDFLTRLAGLSQRPPSALDASRVIGGSFHDRVAARWAVRKNLVDIAFSRYNALHRKAESELFPFLPSPKATLLYNFKNTKGWLCGQRFVDLVRAEGLALPSEIPQISDA